MNMNLCMSDHFLKQLVLSNGLTISFADETRRYFGDFHLVKLQIMCKIVITSDLFADERDLAEARRLLGDEIIHRRTAEQMGVPSIETKSVLNRLVEDFEKHALPYLGSPSFPQKLAIAHMRKLGSNLPSQPASRLQP